MTDYNFERDIRPVEIMDWSAATHSVPVAEAEERELEVQEIVSAWLKQTDEGRRFNRDFNTPENRTKLRESLELIGADIAFDTLSDVFNRLMQNGKLLPYQAPPSKAEIEQSNKAKYEADTLAWYNRASSKQIRERIEKGDKAFASWMTENRFEVVLENSEAVPAQILGTNTPGYNPDQLAWQRKEERTQQKRDTEYTQIEQKSPGLHAFAEEYKHLSASETKRRMADPTFRKSVELASSYNLI